MHPGEEQFLQGEALAARGWARESLRRIAGAAVEIVDPRNWIARHPLASTTAALGTGALAGMYIARAAAPPGAKSEPAPSRAADAGSAAFAHVGRAVTSALTSALLAKLLSNNSPPQPVAALAQAEEAV